MNFDFSDDLKALREQARKFLRERCPTATVRRVLEGPEPYDLALWKEIGAMGWTGAAIPEALGGAGLWQRSIGHNKHSAGVEVTRGHPLQDLRRGLSTLAEDDLDFGRGSELILIRARSIENDRQRRAGCVVIAGELIDEFAADISALSWLTCCHLAPVL